ncbi:MAG: fibronectin type III-like domain-contianing protein, partial [Acidobacteria bacterium]|nr:fibronectin type III-like domain-contianing protein [Acidobacteriota bacterium]
YRYFRDEPLYPFGYGLSYTTFSYSNAKVDHESAGPSDTVTISADISNTGSMAGDEVVELYLTHTGIAGAPIRALEGFKRVHLNRGERQNVAFTLRDRDLSVVDESGKRRVSAGDVEVWIGSGQPLAPAGRGKVPGVATKFTITQDASLPD